VQDPSSGVVGSKFGDSATVSGATGAPTPTGTVSFTLYSDNHCGTAIAGPIAETLSAGKASIPDASKLVPQAGSYWWVASYGGDSFNSAAKSGCADEPITVGPASPAIVTSQEPAAGVVGATFKDKATLSGLFGATPGGSVSWKLYTNSKCEGQALASDGPVTVTANGDYKTPDGASPVQAGTYYWVATYTGDANNKEIASGCADEPITVGVPPQPAVAVLPAKFVSGGATAHGPVGCIARSTPVYVKGTLIKSATFYLDGHKLKSVLAADKQGRYGVKIASSKLGFGAHRVKVQVVFTAASQTKSIVLHAAIVRCRLVQPKFTG
jgi:hypothetical protein